MKCSQFCVLEFYFHGFVACAQYVDCMEGNVQVGFNARISTCSNLHCSQMILFLKLPLTTILDKTY